MIWQLFPPESPGEPEVVTVSTAVAVTVDERTAIAAGRSHPRPRGQATVSQCQEQVQGCKRPLHVVCGASAVAVHFPR